MLIPPGADFMLPTSTLLVGGSTLGFGEDITATQPADRHCLGRPTEAQTATKFLLLEMRGITSIAGTWSGARLSQCNTRTLMSLALANTAPWFPWIYTPIPRTHYGPTLEHRPL